MKNQFLLSCCFLFLSTILSAQDWQHLGSAQVMPNSIYQNGDTVYASTLDDLLESYDGGETWISILDRPIQDLQLVWYSGQVRHDYNQALYTKDAMLILNGQTYTGVTPWSSIKIDFSKDGGRTTQFLKEYVPSGRGFNSQFNGFYRESSSVYFYEIRNASSSVYFRGEISYDGGDTWSSFSNNEKFIGWLNDYYVMFPDISADEQTIKFRDSLSSADLFSIPLSGNNAELLFTDSSQIYSIGRVDSTAISFCSVGFSTDTLWQCQDFAVPFNSNSIGTFFREGESIFYGERFWDGSNSIYRLWRKANIYDSEGFELSTEPTSSEELCVGSGKGKNSLKIFPEEILSSTNQGYFRANGKKKWEQFSFDFTPPYADFTIVDFFKLNGKYFFAGIDGGLYSWSGISGENLEVIVQNNNATNTQIGMNYSDGRLFFYTNENSVRGFAYYTDDGVSWGNLPTGGVRRWNYLKTGDRIIAQTELGTGYEYSDDNGATWRFTPTTHAQLLREDQVTGDLYFFSGGNLTISKDRGISFENHFLSPYPWGTSLNVSPPMYQSALLHGGVILRTIENRIFRRNHFTDLANREVSTDKFLRAVSIDLHNDKFIFNSLAEGVWEVDASDFMLQYANIEGLSLIMDRPANINPDASENVPLKFTLKNNNATLPFENIKVGFDIEAGKIQLESGNEFSATTGTLIQANTNTPVWEIDELLPQESAEITLNSHTLVKDAIQIFGQVNTADGQDLNSTPGNGICCSQLEDDEVYFLLNPSLNRKPDLVFPSGQGPSVLLPGNRFSFDLRLQNIGNNSTANPSYRVLLSKDDQLSSDDELLVESRFFTWFSQGTIREQLTVFTIPTDADAENYFLLYEVDPLNEILESDERNNVTAVPLSVPIPPYGDSDLFFESFDLPEKGVISDVSFFRHEVKNNGPNPSTSAVLTFHLSEDRFLGTGDRQIRRVTLPALLPEDTSPSFEVFSIPNVPPGDYFLLLTADNTNVVPETNEDNNVVFSPFEVIDNSNTPPDLVVENLEIVQNGPYFSGDFVDIRFDIKNVGTGYAIESRFNITITDDLDPTSTTIGGITNPYVPGLEPGESFSVLYERIKISDSNPDGEYFMRVFSDASNYILEVDETNNSAWERFYVGFPPEEIDLSLKMNIPNSIPKHLTHFPITILVENSGTETATGVEAELPKPDALNYRRINSTIASQGLFDSDIWKIGTLEPGASAQLTVYYFRKDADAFDCFAQITKVNEPDEDSVPNNGNCCISNEDDEAVFSFSKVLPKRVSDRNSELKNEADEADSILKIAPNPFSNHFVLEVFSTGNQIVPIAIFDILGKCIFEKTIDLKEGENQFSLDAKEFPKGILFLKLKGVGEIKMLKI